MAGTIAARDALSAALDRLAPVSLPELDAAAALQTRLDRKYIVPPRVASALLESSLAAAPGLQVLSIAGDRTARYASVYFDTPELDSYRGAAHGRRRRFKVRTRAYVDSGLCFLEVKTAGGRGETIKARIPHDPRRPDALDASAQAFLSEHLDRDVRWSLEPVLATAYGRATLLQGGTAPARLTMDTALVCRDVAADRPEGAATVSLGDAVLIETKSSGGPTAADRWLWSAGHRPVRVSKYCVGLALARPGLPSNKWHRTIRRHFGPPASGHVPGS